MRPCFVEHRWKLPSPVGGSPRPGRLVLLPRPRRDGLSHGLQRLGEGHSLLLAATKVLHHQLTAPSLPHTQHRQPSHTYTCSNSVTNGSAIEYRAPPPPRAGPRPPLRCGPLSGTPTWACARPAPGPPRPNAERKESGQQQRKEIAVCQPALAVAGKRSERPGGVTLTPSRRPPPVTVP